MTRTNFIGADPILIDLGELADFISLARRSGWANEDVDSRREGFWKIYEFERDGGWLYRDRYAGSLIAPGMETVEFNRNPLWVMVYGGEGVVSYKSSEDIREAFSFLRRVLSSNQMGFTPRGPRLFEENLSNEGGKITYTSSDTYNHNLLNLGDIHGNERIVSDGLLFTQWYHSSFVLGRKK